MTEARRKLARELLAKATPRPWKAGVPRDAIVAPEQPTGSRTGHADHAYYGGELVCESVLPQNVDLIAAAPDLLAEALDEIDRLQQGDVTSTYWKSLYGGSR